MLVAAGGALAAVGLTACRTAEKTVAVQATRAAAKATPSPRVRVVARDGHHGEAGHRTVETQAGAEAEPMYYIHDGDKAIALTIDDGPSPVYTPQILDLLDRYKITASFSMIGRSAAEYPEIAREVARAGHLIVNHTWDHADLVPLDETGVHDEIARATDAIHQATGDTPRIFRAPYGAWSKTVLDYCGRNQLTALDWSVDPRDWAMPGTRAIVDNILGYTRTGSIILEHDGGGNRSETVAALAVVIPRLLDEGYHFKTV
jgi:peptidoglycan/xylan/chitin deacetylase (PgdA/CDA1 family)